MPSQEAAVRAAIRAGQAGSARRTPDRAVAGLPKGDEAVNAGPTQSVFEQRLGLFGSLEDAVFPGRGWFHRLRRKTPGCQAETVALKNDRQGDTRHRHPSEYLAANRAVAGRASCIRWRPRSFHLSQASIVYEIVYGLEPKRACQLNKVMTWLKQNEGDYAD